jgi:hypothetical protein
MAQIEQLEQTAPALVQFTNRPGTVSHRHLPTMKQAA